jgi:hypothetical protein
MEYVGSFPSGCRMSARNLFMIKSNIPWVSGLFQLCQLIVECLWEVMHDIGVEEVWEFLDCASCE